MRWGSSAPHRAPESVTENLGSIRLVNAVVPVLGDLLAPLTVLPCIPPQGHDWDDSSLRGGRNTQTVPHLGDSHCETKVFSVSPRARGVCVYVMTARG